MRNGHDFTIVLRNKSNKRLELSYGLLENASAEVWFKCLKNAAEKSFINSTRFYNFRNRTDSSIENLVLELERSIKILSTSLPELGAVKLNNTDDSSLQKSLNELHTNFAHSHLIEKSITNENSQAWSDFNSLIHQIESALIAKRPKKTDQPDISRIEFTWQNNFQTPIPEICYPEFTLQKVFGSIQINYCQVGRHLHELYFAKDENVPKEHIQPQRFFSANSTLWFGPDLNEQYEKETTAKIEEWFNNSKEKFNAAGIEWGNKNKALGSVTVAQLNRNISSLAEMMQFQNELSEYTEVEAVSIQT